MKWLSAGFLLRRDKETESLKPYIMKTLARFVIFADGKTLQQKWDAQFGSSSKVLTERKTYTDADGKTYQWNFNQFGTEQFSSFGRFRIHKANEYTEITNPKSEGTIQVTKIDSSGNTETSEVPWGTSGTIHQYIFTIPLPTDLVEEGCSCNWDDAVINITEGDQSTFMINHMFHSVVPSISEDNLVIKVNHFKNLDGVDLGNVEYITGDFSVRIEGSAGEIIVTN